MANPNEYIVFEPDQVLTNDHLNETFNYLDQQNRWTRNKLIGIGIVCGLDIVLNPGVIRITKGCGITSQGYLILQETTDYTYYLPYVPVDVPKDLPFTNNGNMPFYNPAYTNKNIWKLISDADYSTLESAQQQAAVTLSSAVSFLADYVVVLFLEASETELKNCSMQDCNNSGSTMDFTLRPLLVAIKDLPGELHLSPDLLVTAIRKRLSSQVNLKRFNVPYTALNNTNDVLNAFVKLVDDTTLTQISSAYNLCFQQYGASVNVTSNPFAALLTSLKNYRNNIMAQNPVFIQYFYDFIDDLLKAYIEFSAKASEVSGICCPDENLFPLHLILGLASQATNTYVQDKYRNYFIYSELFSKNGKDVDEVTLLFNRMMILTNNFLVLTREQQLQSAIRITPSRYEYPWLSERAIPYYYKINKSGSELYKYWSYYKTSHSNATYNLSYNATLYSSNDAVTEPLLYDIERFDFFRVEGHIGQDYNSVLSTILSQRLNYNLPFDVLAISADQLQNNAPLPDCNLNDLDTDYKLIVAEAACKIHLLFCFISKLPYRIATTKYNRSKATGTMFEVPEPAALKFSAFKLQKEIKTPVNLYLNPGYQKGDFLRQYCPAVEATIGRAYLSSLSSTGVFTNPVQIEQQVPLTTVYHYLFEFIDAVEQLMFELYSNTIAQLDMTAFNTVYQAYLTDTLITIGILTDLTVVTNKSTANAQSVSLAEDLELDLLTEEMGLLTNICIDERIQVIKDEYTARLTNYQQQLTFLNYYKNHPGLEHKAGVPKGGTLVLVYHSAPNYAFNETANAVDRMLVKQTPSPALAGMDDQQLALISNFVNECKDAPATTKQTIIDMINRIPPRRPVRYPIPDGAVIADFYIPYLCCSDCPPVAYVIPQLPPPVQNKPVISMAETFCDNDSTPEPIQVSAPGGTFNTIKGLDASKQTFTPSVAGAGTYHIVYTLNDVASDPLIITVLPTPDNNFTFTSSVQDQDGSFNISATFNPDKEDSSFTYQWLFGPGFDVTSSNEASPTINAILDPTRGQTDTTVSLVVSNGNCSDPAVVKNLAISANGVYEPGAGNGNILQGIKNLFNKKG